jgi:hypothetical protein
MPYPEPDARETREKTRTGRTVRASGLEAALFGAIAGHTAHPPACCTTCEHTAFACTQFGQRSGETGTRRNARTNGFLSGVSASAFRG